MFTTVGIRATLCGKCVPSVARTEYPVVMSAPVWDAAQGIWVGARAAGECEVPDPLWIFGYGSLCWKAAFPYEEAVVGRVHGWKRFFAQKSADHRGTPESPGLVATLLSDEQLLKLRLRKPEEPASVTCGVCYLVNADDKLAVLENLDFREKGGYTREIIEFHPSDATRLPMRALLYSATPESPGFTADAITDPAAAAHIVGTAAGPSGPNREYLLNLASWLESVAEDDPHISELMSRLPPLERLHVQ